MSVDMSACGVGCCAVAGVYAGLGVGICIEGEDGEKGCGCGKPEKDAKSGIVDICGSKPTPI